MMLGIRASVRNVKHEEVFELSDADFVSKYRYELQTKQLMEGSPVKKKAVKPNKVYEFFDFAPKVFSQIRKFYQIDEIYLKSIGPESLIGELQMGNLSCLSEQSSTGKSGSFFYYTSDGRFMLKTIE